MNSLSRLGVIALVLSASIATLQAEDRAATKPLQILLVTGGCCHDYETQKTIIKKGLEARAHCEVTVVHQGGTTTDTRIPLYEDPNWAKPYDVVIHNECFAGVADPAWTARVLKPHQEGIPAVVVHCAMHCYRDKTDEWFKFCGVTSHGHGPAYPHAVLNSAGDHPVMEGFGPAWANPAGELYRIEKVWPNTTPLAVAKDREKGTEEVCVWTNLYGDTRVFGTTLGHHNETVSDETFLNLLTRGTLWAADKLEDKYLREPSSEPYLIPVDLAKGKKGTASSEETGKNNLVAHAFDGQPGTRWCAANATMPQWLAVDLGKSEKLTGARLEFESSGSVYQYRLEGSVDGSQWKTLVDRSKNENEKSHELEFEAEGIRHVRAQILANRQGGWASIRKFEVFGTEMIEVDPTLASLKDDDARLSDVRVPEGFEKTLFAAPPAVNYPVFVAAAENGDVYVSVDKNGSLDREPRRGAIHRLRDYTGDGKADEVTLFVPDVDSPRGIVWDRDRLYVMHPPHLSAFIDHNGDGRADEQQILVKDIAFGFKDRPADHTSNGVTLGIDGWLYLAIGDFGFMEAEGTDGRKLQMRGGGVMRVRPDGTGLEIYSSGTRNNLEIALDPLLNGFTRDNTNDGDGWDTRLLHFSGLGDHGYPRLYKFFNDEIVQPLADYGGGSGCGALYMDEAGFPTGFGNALYTADWGRGWIYRHLLEPAGATFTLDQNEFIRMTRPTDLDVDAQSNIYASSWKGATFKYDGEDVGYIVKVTPKGYEAPPVPDFPALAEEDLVPILKSPSHRLRLAAQRELLARGLTDEIVQRVKAIVADQNQSLASRVAAIYLLKQALESGSHEFLAEIARQDAQIRPLAIRALADRWDQQQEIPLQVIVDGLKDTAPRTRLESAVALARLNQTEQAAAIATLLDDQDDLVRHTAYKVLVRLNAHEACFQLLDTPSTTGQMRRYARYALQSMHDAKVVDGLISRLAAETDPERRQTLLIALCRLHFVEGEWKGNSWGTRPDFRGPYFQPETWEQSEKIAKVLSTTLQGTGSEEAAWLIGQMSRHRMNLPETLEFALAKAATDPAFTAVAVSLVAKESKIPAGATDLLVRFATDPAQDAATRGEATIALLKSNERDPFVAALVGLARLRGTDVKGAPYLQALAAFQNAKLLESRLDHLRDLAGNSTEEIPREATVWANAGLLHLANQQNAGDRVKRQLTESLASGWSDPARQAKLLEAALIINDRKLEPQVTQLLTSEQPAVAAAAQMVATAWQIGQRGEMRQGPKLETLSPSEAISLAVNTPGNAARGEQLYAKLACNKCHTVEPNEPSRGPYLPNVSKTYNREQLTESIVLPSAVIAQGFATNIFLLDDGRTLSGFVVSEAADAITIRDNQGEEHRINPNQIEARKKDETSIMPAGLVNEITPGELADLVTYLEGLGK